MTAIRTFGLIFAAAVLAAPAARSASFGDLSGGDPGSQFMGPGPYAPGPYAAGPYGAPPGLRPGSLCSDAGLRRLSELRVHAADVGRTGGRAAPGAGRARRIDDAADAGLAEALPAFHAQRRSAARSTAACDLRSGQFDDRPLQSLGSQHAFHVCAVEHSAIGVGQFADMELVAGAIRRPAAQLVGPRNAAQVPE